MKAIRRLARGILSAIRTRPLVFATGTLGVFLLNIFLPPVVLSLARKPWDFFTFNPWLPRLPEFLASSEVPLQRKVEFLPKLALFWFSANGPWGSTEWGYSVHVNDVARFTLLSLLFGAYFALWFASRGQFAQCGVGAKAGRQGGIVGALVSLVGFSTGPCSVVGCGAPILPVVGLALTGLSSGTIAFLSELSSVAIWVVAGAMLLGVGYLAWIVGGATPPAAPALGREERSELHRQPHIPL